MRFLVLSFAVLALAGCNQAKQPAHQASPATEFGQTKGVDRSHAGKPAPDVAFNDPDGQATSMAQFKGAPVLVNLWATWCAPCVQELPTLNRLSRSNRIAVLALSQDMGPHASVVAFLQAHRIANLDAYQDPKMGFSGALNADVLPTSILFDAQGREVWRYVGDLDWTGAEAAKLLAEAGAPKTS